MNFILPQRGNKPQHNIIIFHKSGLNTSGAKDEKTEKRNLVLLFQGFDVITVGFWKRAHKTLKILSSLYVALLRDLERMSV